MSSGATKKVILSLITAGTGGTVIKVAVDSSATEAVLPLAVPEPVVSDLNQSNISEPIHDPQPVADTFNQVFSDQITDTNNRTKRSTRWQDWSPKTDNRYRNPFDPFSHIDNSPTGRGEAWEKVNKELSEEEKKVIRQEAKRVLTTLNDYTFKIFGPCVYGTGWILDYQIPEKKGAYPTTWYIVTNAHVIQNFRFGSNPYDQILPKNLEETKSLRGSEENYQNVLKRHRDAARLDMLGTNCDSPSKYGYLDINIAQDKEGVNIDRKADYGLVSQGRIKEPRLFFSAIDFLKENPNKDTDFGHYADFAVLEIEFTNESNAKLVTGNFAENYNLNSSNNVLNVFAAPLEKKYTKQQLKDFEDNIYILAYPGGKRNKWEPTNNFNEETAIASHLGGTSYYERETRYRDGYRGFVKAQNKKHPRERIFNWGGKQLKEFGHYYEIQHHPMERGSSGGVFVDKNLDALAVTAVTTIGAGAFSSWILPLRSSGVTFNKGGETITTPAYDLILGGKNHNNSYKQQVEKYVLKENKRTWLSARNWGYSDDYDVLSWF